MGFRVVFIAALLALVYHVTKACDITRECPENKQVTWATDGKECHVFENSCFLEKTNCHLQNKNETELQIISQASCQTLCITKCKQDNNPVCGYYNEEKITFPNQCEMESYVCRTGEALHLFSIGPCE